MDIWQLYGAYATPESRRPLSDEQRQLLAVCDLRQEVNSGGFDTYLRFWGADTAPDALAIVEGALGEPWRQGLVEALDIFGTANPSTADERAEVLDDAAEADDMLGMLDERFYELEGSQDADAALGQRAEALSPWPDAGTPSPKRRLWGRKSD
ncbi:DUF4375 domain-containing protein [Phycicoccus sp.]|uniref:DMP19 family protein n=1 Tax=Phycicoccus sp. TaxID=1902410 RepID=UPI002CD0333F|nr:DUF4375 domain-containing protein [Phycicoccus sp.]HMM95829.1 DUF4375 domain-containing protein [Phycicoccus sp.]